MGLFKSGKPTRNEFAAALVSAIRDAGYEGEIRDDPKENAIILLSDSEVAGQMNVANLFPPYRDAGKKQRADLLSQYAQIAMRTTRKLPDEYELAKPHLRPTVSSRATFELQRLKGVAGRPISDAEHFVEIPVGRHLVASLGYDWPESVQSVPPEWLKTWGVEAEQAVQDAIVNLAEATGGYVAIGSSIYGFAEGDSYDASRIFLTGLVEDMEVNGRRVAMVPHRDVLMITGTDDEDGLTVMVEQAEESLSDLNALSPVPLVYEDNWWVDWMPPEGHRLRRRYRELYLRWIGGLYEQQKPLLEARYAASGEEVFVGSFSPLDRGGGLESYGVWGEGVTTLLPESDLVGLMSPGQEPVMGTWERVIEVAGDLLEETGHYPPRYRTKRFPDADSLAAIGQGRS